jgi:hypothetical protein
MNNNNDVIDDYFSSQLDKCPAGHGKLITPSAVKEDDPESIKMAKVYQRGAIHGAEIERSRILELLDKNLGSMDWEDIAKLIQEEDND